MSNNATADEIKASIAISRKKPVNFALCLGKKPEGMIALFHRKKAPDKLARQAKKDGETNKVAYGTVETKGKVLQLTLAGDPPPGLLKNGKLFFKSIGLAVKLRLLDEDGNVLDADDISDADEAEAGAGPANDGQDQQGADQNDPNAAKWDAVFQKVDPLVTAALAKGGPATASIETAWNAASDSAQAGDYPAALKVAAKIVPILQGLDEKKPESDPKAKAWAKISATLEKQVLAALKANHPEAGKIRAVWGFAQEKADAGDFDAAIKAAQRLQSLLSEATAEASSDSPPENVVAFQRSRLMWIEAKKAMRSDLEKFSAAVAQQSSDDEDQSDIARAVDDLVAEFNAFDTRLEDVLDEITQTPEGAARSKLKQSASVTIGTYLNALERPFFKAVDTNPFVAVNVAGRGRQSLSVVQSTLT